MKRLTTLKSSEPDRSIHRYTKHSKHKHSNFVWTILKRQKEENSPYLFKRPRTQYQNFVNIQHQPKLYDYIPNKYNLKNI